MPSVSATDSGRLSAATGHTLRQMPQATQFSLTTAMPLTMSRAPCGQASTQAPQPMHNASSMTSMAMRYTNCSRARARTNSCAASSGLSP